MISVKNVPVLALVILFPALLSAQERRTGDTAIARHEFSISQAMDYAKKNNVAIKNALLDIKYQEQVNKEITSRAYPAINGSLSTSYNPNVATQVIPNFISPSTYQVLVDEGVKDGNGNPIQMPGDFGFIAAQFGTKYSATGAISLSQILFDGQVFVGLQARQATLDFAAKNAEVTEEQIRANVHKVYYQLVVSRKQLELLDSNIANFGRLLRDTRIIYENGFASKLDVDRVSVQLTNLQTERARVVTGISNGYFGLKVLIGMPVRDELVLTDTLDENSIKDNILGLDQYKYDDRKEYQYAQIGKRLNEFNIRRYQLSRIPTVSLSGQYAKNAQRDKWNFFGRGEWFSISSINLNINIPIFNGFYTKAKVEQARIDLARTQNEITALELTIDSEVETAKNNYRSAILSMDAQRKNMELAQEVFNQTRKKYEVGTGSQTEINTAQVDLKAAQTNYITALYDAIVARIDFLKAVGKL